MTELKNVDDLIPKEIEEQWDDIIDYEYPELSDYDYDYELHEEDPDILFDDLDDEDYFDLYHSDDDFWDYEYPFSKKHDDFRDKITLLFQDLNNKSNFMLSEVQTARKIYGENHEIVKERRKRWAYFDEAVENIRIFCRDEKISLY